MATKNYTLKLNYDNSTSESSTFSLPDNKVANYNMTIKLDNGKTYTKTISVGTAPHTYTITANRTSGSPISANFTTPYYKISAPEVSVNYNPASANGGSVRVTVQNTNIVTVTGSVGVEDTSTSGAYDQQSFTLNAWSSATFTFKYDYATFIVNRAYASFQDSENYQQQRTNVAKANFSIDKADISYPAMPAHVSAFTIYVDGTAKVTNPSSAGSLTIDTGSKVYATAVATTGYNAPTVSGISTNSSSPTTISGDVSISVTAGAIKYYTVTLVDSDWHEFSVSSVSVPHGTTTSYTQTSSNSGRVTFALSTGGTTTVDVTPLSSGGFNLYFSGSSYGSWNSYNSVYYSPRIASAPSLPTLLTNGTITGNATATAIDSYTTNTLTNTLSTTPTDSVTKSGNQTWTISGYTAGGSTFSRVFTARANNTRNYYTIARNSTATNPSSSMTFTPTVTENVHSDYKLTIPQNVVCGGNTTEDTFTISFSSNNAHSVAVTITLYGTYNGLLLQANQQLYLIADQNETYSVPTTYYQKAYNSYTQNDVTVKITRVEIEFADAGKTASAIVTEKDFVNALIAPKVQTRVSQQLDGWSIQIANDQQVEVDANWEIFESEGYAWRAGVEFIQAGDEIYIETGQTTSLVSGVSFIEVYFTANGFANSPTTKVFFD